MDFWRNAIGQNRSFGMLREQFQNLTSHQTLESPQGPQDLSAYHSLPQNQLSTAVVSKDNAFSEFDQLLTREQLSSIFNHRLYGTLKNPGTGPRGVGSSGGQIDSRTLTMLEVMQQSQPNRRVDRTGVFTPVELNLVRDRSLTDVITFVFNKYRGKISKESIESDSEEVKAELLQLKKCFAEQLIDDFPNGAPLLVEAGQRNHSLAITASALAERLAVEKRAFSRLHDALLARDGLMDENLALQRLRGIENLLSTIIGRTREVRQAATLPPSARVYSTLLDAFVELETLAVREPRLRLAAQMSREARGAIDTFRQKLILDLEARFRERDLDSPEVAKRIVLMREVEKIVAGVARTVQNPPPTVVELLNRDSRLFNGFLELEMDRIPDVIDTLGKNKLYAIYRSS